jgi:hypothetical protein
MHFNFITDFNDLVLQGKSITFFTNSHELQKKIMRQTETQILFRNTETISLKGLSSDVIIMDCIPEWFLRNVFPNSLTNIYIYCTAKL